MLWHCVISSVGTCIMLHNPRGRKHTEAEICTGSGKLCLQLNRISPFKLEIHLNIIE